MGSYVPYLALLAVLHVDGRAPRLRARPAPHPALGRGRDHASSCCFFGSGFENLFWGAQIGFVGATAMGLGALLLLDDVPTLPGRGRAAAATGLLIVAVMTSGYGLFMLGLVGLDVLLDPRRRKWVVPLLIPAALYGAWYLDPRAEQDRDLREPVHARDARRRSRASSSMGWRRRSAPPSAAGR